MKKTNEKATKKTRKTGLGRSLETLLAETNLTAAERMLKAKEPVIESFVKGTDFYAAIAHLDMIVHELGGYAEAAEVEAIKRDLMTREVLNRREEIHLTMCEVYKRLREKYPEIG